MDTFEILKAFDAKMQKHAVRLHGCVLMQGEQVIARHYQPPYTAQKANRMYSTTKSVIAVAIGLALGEGKLSLEDKVADFFRDEIDMSQLHPYAAEMTVRNLLMMSTAYSKPTYSPKNMDWLASYFRAPATHPADTLWWYDSSGSYVLGAIVKRVTGMPVGDYLRPLFDEIGVSPEAYFLNGPDGETWAGSGFIATTSDLARIAYLLLNHGRWNGKQLLPEDYAIAATAPQIQNDDGATHTRFNCGYGYQIWILPEGAFAFKGMGGQLAIGFPGRDLVFACNADTQGNNTTYDDILNGVEDIILPHFPITDRAEFDRVQPKAVTETVFDAIENVNYKLNDNHMHISSLRFEREGETYKLFYTRRGTEHCIPFAIDRETTISFPQKYSGRRLFCPETDMQYQCSVIGRWLEPHKIHIRVWAEDLYVGNMSMCFSFRGDRIGVKMARNAQFFFDDFNGFAGGEAVR